MDWKNIPLVNCDNNSSCRPTDERSTMENQVPCTNNVNNIIKQMTLKVPTAGSHDSWTDPEVDPTSQDSSVPHAPPSTQYSGVLETCSFVRSDIKKEICQQVIRCKLSKRRHLVLSQVLHPNYLNALFPTLLQYFQPQSVHYNGGIAHITTWKISCYLEVMDHGIPTAEPNTRLREHFLPVLEACNDLFLFWYQQQHSCNTSNRFHPRGTTVKKCHRLMTFITRYTPAPGEQALLKVRPSCRLLVVQ
jgi:hypothetical protein